MEPVEEVKSQLFHSNGVSEGRISQFSCDHVIEKENLLAMTLAKGPTGVDMEFTFKNRTDSRLINELGQMVLNVSRVTPGIHSSIIHLLSRGSLTAGQRLHGRTDKWMDKASYIML